MVRFVNLTLAGITSGMVFATVALALVLIWRSTRIVNFAQGGMLMVTTFLAWTVVDAGGSYWVALAAALASGLVLGAVIERVVIRPVEDKPPLNAVIVTLGLFVLLQAGAGMVWGDTPHSYPPAFGIRGLSVGGTRLLLSPNDLFVIGAVGAVMIALTVLFVRTDLGLRLRAAAFEPGDRRDWSASGSTGSPSSCSRTRRPGRSSTRSRCSRRSRTSRPASTSSRRC